MAARSLSAFLVLLLMGACAGQPTSAPKDPKDPWEERNRKTYGLNDSLDKAVLQPTARGYRKVTPVIVRRGVSNFFANLNYPVVFVNDFLQGKFAQGGQDVLRFVLNSTIGVAGLFDVATAAGLEENNEDLGQTLAVWGVPAGPYFMVPFFGPSTARDAPASIVDFFMDLRTYFEPNSVQYSLFALDVIDLRYRLLSADDILADSYDPYVTIRNAYLQRRRFLIHDGDPPQDDDPFEDEFFDDEEFDEEFDEEELDEE